MKNRLEAELISIAHRILKLKNKSEVIQLQQEALALYEKLSVLRFVEENYDDVSIEIPADVEARLENTTLTKEEAVVQEKVNETKEEAIITQSETLFADFAKEEKPKKEEKLKIDDFQVRFEEFEAQLSNAKPTQTKVVVEEVTIEEEPIFVPVEAVKKEQPEPKKEEPVATEPAKNISINDAVKKSFNIGLNDRIAFEFHLFGGQTEDFNRVLSQLNTFQTFAEAKDFIENVVKPDYNNWVSKEEYEARFLEIIESKF